MGTCDVQVKGEDLTSGTSDTQSGHADIVGYDPINLLWNKYATNNSERIDRKTLRSNSDSSNFLSFLSIYKLHTHTAKKYSAYDDKEGKFFVDR